MSIPRCFWWAITLSVGVAGEGVASAPPTVDQILVSQGIQDETNSIPLGTGRSAVVRAKIDTGGGPYSGVTETLTVKNGTVTVGSKSGML